MDADLRGLSQIWPLIDADSGKKGRSGGEKSGSLKNCCGRKRGAIFQVLRRGGAGQGEEDFGPDD